MPMTPNPDTLMPDAAASTCRYRFQESSLDGGRALAGRSMR